MSAEYVDAAGADPAEVEICFNPQAVTG